MTRYTNVDSGRVLKNELASHSSSFKEQKVLAYPCSVSLISSLIKKLAMTSANQGNLKKNLCSFNFNEKNSLMIFR